MNWSVGVVIEIIVLILLDQKPRADIFAVALFVKAMLPHEFGRAYKAGILFKFSLNE